MRWALPLAIWLASACAHGPGLGPSPHRVFDPISAAHRDRVSRQRARGRVAGPPGTAPSSIAAVASYRALISPTLGARCRLLPSDSEYLDRRARACGALSAAAWSVARVLLEAGASPELLPPTLHGGQLRFLDLPPAPGACSP